MSHPIEAAHGRRHRRSLCDRVSVVLATLTALLSLSGCGFTSGHAVSGGVQLARSAAAEPVAFSAPGRIEGISETIGVGSAIDGVIEGISVSEGESVAVGSVLARIACDDRRIDLYAARASVDVARQIRERLLRGSRVEERRAAGAKTAAAQATLQRASERFARVTSLWEQQVASREEVDQVRRDLEVAKQALEEAKAQEELVNAPPLPEELARADAEVAVEENRARSAEAIVTKCQLRSPIRGTVVKRHMLPGEFVSTVFPQPVVSVADLSNLQVRAEVDEEDIGRVHLAQRALISADALGQTTYAGNVKRIGSTMGRKRVRSGDPAEKSDRDVLEVIVSLANTDATLKGGLRVTVKFLE